MIRFAVDTDRLTDLDQPAHILLTYSDLVHDGVQVGFPLNGRALVLINRGLGDPSGTATVWDVESGAIPVGDLPVLYDGAHSRGLKNLTVYCSRDTLPAVNAAMGKRSVYHWVATLDGTVHVGGWGPLRGPAAVQCFNSNMLGIHADGSLVFDSGWNPTPALVSARLLAERLDMQLRAVNLALDTSKGALYSLTANLAQLS